MRRFTSLYFELDATTRTAEKVRALEAYFEQAPASDAAWALSFLIGRKLKRSVNTRLLRDWVAEAAGLPLWLVEESYDSVGDLAETLALLLPETAAQSDASLTDLVENSVVPLRASSPERQKEIVLEGWRRLSSAERLVWHKILMGEFRVGVARTLVARALAGVAKVPPAEMAHRLMGHWEPTAADYGHLIAPLAGSGSPGKPYPFFLAHPLEASLESLGERDAWQAEWKWDGIRAQLIRRQGQVLVWSRGEELITDRFPEVQEIGRVLPDGTVLDGEILCWRDDRPLPFAMLQRRIGRKTVGAKLLAEAPVAFMAYDILEHEAQDIRLRPLSERRALLETLASGVHRGFNLRLSQIVAVDRWQDLARERASARERSVEGLMLKRLDSPYGVGRPRGDWWKWKVSPLAIDAVLIYAQRGHGRRASLYSDYTFGVWEAGQLVPIAKAYSGLTDQEIGEVDKFVRRNTLDRFGPVRVVKPELVFELHFEGIQISKRHKAGLAVRFPRMARWRHDKPAVEADTLEALKSLATSVAAEAAQ